MNDPRTLLSHPELHSHQSFPHFRTVGEAPKNRARAGALLLCRRARRRGRVRAAADVHGLPAARQLLPAEDGARGADPEHRERRGAEGLFVGGPGRAAARRGARVQLAGLARAARAADRHHHGLPRRRTCWRLPRCTPPARSSPCRSTSGSASTTSSRSRSSGRSPTTSTPKARAAGCFAFIGVGSSLGAWLGAEAAAALVARTTSDPRTLMIIGGGAARHLFSVVIVIVNRREVRHAPMRSGSSRTPQPIVGRNGFALIFSDRYLLLIAAADGAAQRRQQRRRVPARQAGERRRRWRCSAATRMAGDRQRFIGGVLRHVLRARQPARVPAAAVRHVAPAALPWACAARCSSCRSSRS